MTAHLEQQREIHRLSRRVARSGRAVATLDVLISGTASTPHVHKCLQAFRDVLRAAADRGTRFYLTIA